MAPPAQTLERDLKKVVRERFEKDEELTVNAVRKRVEEMHKLGDGFFIAPEWKARSKKIITELVERLAEGNASDEEDDAKELPEALDSRPAVRLKPKRANGVKRSSPSETPPAAKRQKKAAPARPVKKRKPAKKVESESELSEEDEEDEDEDSESEAELSEDEAPKPRRKGAKKAAKDNSDSELSDLGSSDEEQPKPKPKPKSKTTPKAKPKAKPETAKSESELSSPGEDEEVEKNDEGKSSGVPKTETAQGDTKTGDIIDSDSELSSVIDEPPPKKRAKAAVSKGSSKPSSAKAPPKQLSADEEEIKKLQGQLVKCGIRKIWGIELKQYGDDGKAKIRHLRRMLTDAGMTGRFSEARAKEIKEQRELMADLEAVNDMNALWGSAGAGGRASRSRAPKKSLKEASDEDHDENDDEDNDHKGADNDDDDEEAKANSRVSRRMADLAFLGDDSESD
ncbi:hypothetical protein Micbo1qcDRAFT_196312 [Microdochium bolleyi]|uniref:Transcriptional regulator n=1 Tax=Microdochium bolleyi TaxID=196109 RepID=A0A136IYW3_9PEZI|nr:hypothetical protein Micbo1qcDRAFT_196312 [Microdochium bolleyi]